MARRILFFGFSVTEPKDGYVAHLQNAISTSGNDVEIFRIGIGGNHPPAAAHVFDLILPEGPFDDIFLDLTTTPYRRHFNAATRESIPRAALAVATLIHKAAARGARVCLLHLYRADVDPDDDLIRLCDLICRWFDIPGHNVGAAVARLPDEARRQYLRDEVHPTQHGCARYAEFVRDILDRDDLRHPRIPAAVASICDSIGAVEVHAVAGVAPARRFTRGNIDLGVSHIEEAGSLMLRLPGRVCILGLG